MNSSTPSSPLPSSIDVTDAIAWYNVAAIGVDAVSVPGGVEFTLADRTVTVTVTSADDFSVRVCVAGATVVSHQGLSYGVVGGIARKAALAPLAG